ncbi:MAG: ribosome alternative rescue factor ArfA [Alteromonadaceae bacterium]|nr:ribosome alternative rescue factor ArfA [Alteromonadaceae bacterium]
MSKFKRNLNSINGNKNDAPVETGRGTVKDNFLAALVTSRVFKMQVVKAKKGKGAYKRKDKHKGRESYLMAA